LYASVHNQPTLQFDAFGLCGGVCGPDVTLNVDRVLAGITRAYRGWSLWQKGRACARLYNAIGNLWGSGSENAWDISPLNEVNAHNEGVAICRVATGTGSCARTVTYDSGCYYASAVNYLMWGHVNSLCAETFLSSSTLFDSPSSSTILGGPLFSMESTMRVAWARKLWISNFEPGVEEQQAMLFTLSGYAGVKPRGAGGLSCGAGRSLPKGCQFSWTWRPLQGGD
jgi:hypothetical protein